ncbi:MAG: hypothetical protein PVI97_05960 [Candidatus Thiodiazotropha sp.]|jgi:hypothetical protein
MDDLPKRTNTLKNFPGAPPNDYPLFEAQTREVNNRSLNNIDWIIRNRKPFIPYESLRVSRGQNRFSLTLEKRLL